MEDYSMLSHTELGGHMYEVSQKIVVFEDLYFNYIFLI